ADAVDGEPADTGHDRVDAGRKDVAEEAERAATDHHLRKPGLRHPGREDPRGARPERRTEHDGPERLPEGEAEIEGPQDAHRYRGELHVGRGPGPQQLQRTTVPLGL